MSTAPENLPAANIFPIAYGNEEETGLMDDYYGAMEEPYKLAGELGDFVPPEVLGHKPRFTLFLKNGSKIYPGGAVGQASPTNIERATPECSSPAQLALYLRASELLLTKTVERFLEKSSKSVPGELHARIQRRVVDGNGSRKACHDNFGIAPGTRLAGREELPGSVLAHLASRSFITGAGYVTSTHGLHYAQKLRGLSQVNGYGYFGSMYRTTNAEGTHRIEIRCNDINISDWAVRTRVGGTAIALALSQTRLGDVLPAVFSHRAIERSKAMSAIGLRRDGTIVATPEQNEAVNIQQAMAQLFLDEISNHTEDVPAELYRTAVEIDTFCDDFKQVLAGEATIELLANRADWAAKFAWLLRRMERDKEFGIKRDLSDIHSRAADMRYDYMGLSAIDGELQTPRLGLGYKLRNKGHFKGTNLTPDEIKTAYLRPPTQTRAALRVKLLQKYDVASCDWHTVTIKHEGESEIFYFKNVLQTSLPEIDAARLAEIKPTRH